MRSISAGAKLAFLRAGAKLAFLHILAGLEFLRAVHGRILPRAVLAMALFLTALPGGFCRAEESPGASGQEQPAAPAHPPTPSGAPAAPAPSPEPGFKCPPASLGVGEAVKDFVAVSNGLITIRAKNGKLIELADQRSEEDPASNMSHCIKDYLPEYNLLLVGITYYEEGGFVAVNLDNGDAALYHGVYRLSPDAKRLLHIDCSLSDTSFVQILKLTPCGLVQEYIRQTTKALSQTDFVWKDDHAVEMTYSPDTPHERSGKSMGVILKGQDFWRIEWTELAHELMGWKTNPENPQGN